MACGKLCRFLACAGTLLLIVAASAVTKHVYLEWAAREQQCAKAIQELARQQEQCGQKLLQQEVRLMSKNQRSQGRSPDPPMLPRQPDPPMVTRQAVTQDCPATAQGGQESFPAALAMEWTEQACFFGLGCCLSMTVLGFVAHCILQSHKKSWSDQETEHAKAMDRLKRKLQQSEAKLEEMVGQKDKAENRLGEYESEHASKEAGHRHWDLVIGLCSLDLFATSMRVAVLRAVSSQLQLDVDVKVKIVAVMGLVRTGKTFLINQLCQVSLSSCSVLGFAFLYQKETNLLFIEAPGLQAKGNYKAGSTEPVINAKATEGLIFEMVDEMACYKFLVVNQLTLGEQQYIKYWEQRSGKLIVVNNFRETRCIELAKQLFHDQVPSCYSGEADDRNQMMFNASGNSEKNGATHVTICKDKSPAGLEHNPTVLEVLRSILQHSIELRPKMVNPLKLFKRTLEGKLETFLLVRPSVQAKATESLVFVPVDPKPYASDYPEAGYIAALSEGLSLKTHEVIDEHGQTVSVSSSFSPDVTVCEESLDNFDLRTIIIECPGCTEEHVEFRRRLGNFHLALTKPKLIPDGQVSYLTQFPCRLTCGTFKKDFFFEGWEVPDREHPVDVTNGILTIKFRKSTAEEVYRPARALQAHGWARTFLDHIPQPGQNLQNFTQPAQLTDQPQTDGITSELDTVESFDMSLAEQAGFEKIVDMRGFVVEPTEGCDNSMLLLPTAGVVTGSHRSVKKQDA